MLDRIKSKPKTVAALVAAVLVAALTALGLDVDAVLVAAQEALK